MEEDMRKKIEAGKYFKFWKQRGGGGKTDELKEKNTSLKSQAMQNQVALQTFLFMYVYWSEIYVSDLAIFVEY